MDRSVGVEQLNTLDIGIMPLPNDTWANGKRGLKGLAYMACGVATIMSEVGVNRNIINTAPTVLADNDYRWYNLLCELIEHPELQERKSEKCPSIRDRKILRCKLEDHIP